MSASQFVGMDLLTRTESGHGYQRNSAQRLDAFALNSYVHTSMKRVCYEIKTSRADFLCEMKQPLKRRIGLRYSNEFYFVTPGGLLDISEIPVECGLIEIETCRSKTQNAVQLGPETFTHFAPEHEAYCRVVVPGPVERDARSDVAICRQHATKSEEGVPRATSEATSAAAAGIRLIVREDVHDLRSAQRRATNLRTP